MTELLRSELVGTAGLSVAAIVAVLLTVLRRPVAAGTHRRQATLAMAVVLVLQIVHAAEEFLTRFYQEFPSMLRLVEWPASFFLIVNMVCLALWTISLFLIGAGVAAGAGVLSLANTQCDPAIVRRLHQVDANAAFRRV